MARELLPRTEQVLDIVVREYVANAVPVSSRLVTMRYELGVSPATVRNEMAVLEEMGYLTHPHTSAGRVPTVSGYRYFVDNLMHPDELTPYEQTQIEGELQRAERALDLDQCMSLAVSLLARTTGSAAWVTQPRARRPRIRHVDLVPLDSRRAILILVPYDGPVRENVLPLPRRTKPGELDALARRLNEQLTGKERFVIAEDADALIRLVLGEIQRLLEAMQAESGPALYRHGLSHVLSQPEFTEIEQARQVLELWERGELINFVLSQPRQGPVQVIIGGEGRWDRLHDFSLVYSTYGARGRSTGWLGVLGPLRMPYGKAVSAVGFVSHLLSRKLHEIYGH